MSHVVAALGDSVPWGLGVGNHGYPRYVAEALDAELIDLTAISLQAKDTLALVDDAQRASIVLIGHGATEGIVRFRSDLARFLPNRYAEVWRLDPRPYFSRRRTRRAIQKAESWLRVQLKRLLISFPGATSLRSAAEYEDDLRRLVAALPSSARIVIVGTVAIDERGFPGSSRSLREMDAAGRSVARDLDLEFVEVAGLLHRWDHYLADNFHPNAPGHRRIAEAVLAVFPVSTVS